MRVLQGHPIGQGESSRRCGEGADRSREEMDQLCDWPSELGCKTAQIRPKLWRFQPMNVKVKNLGCALDEVVILSISDAAYAAQPGARSQGGLLVAMAHPGILQGDAPLCIMEACSARLQRVVRCSMSAELSEAATATNMVII